MAGDVENRFTRVLLDSPSASIVLWPVPSAHVPLARSSSASPTDTLVFFAFYAAVRLPSPSRWRHVVPRCPPSGKIKTPFGGIVLGTLVRPPLSWLDQTISIPASKNFGVSYSPLKEKGPFL